MRSPLPSAIALLSMVACGPVAEPFATSPERPSPRVADVEMPGPARGRKEQAVTDNQACERCHPTEADEWRRSLHKTADEEPSYRRAFAIEPMPFCRGCHAPEANPEEPESPEVAALGVGCVTCHVTSAGVLAAPWHGPGEPKSAPHEVTRDARFGSDAACARCHEFAFPGTLGRTPDDKMQWTVTEHARSESKDTPCAGCHMPDDGHGRRSHVFSASRDPSMMARAVSVEVRREGAGRVRVVVSPRAAGHAFPTGDLFRRVEVLAQIEGPDHLVLGSDIRYLGRHFATHTGAPGRRLTRDDRVHLEPVTVLLDVGPTAGKWPIAYRVAYQRVDHPNGPDEENAAIDGEIVLAEGVLPPPARPPSEPVERAQPR